MHASHGPHGAGRRGLLAGAGAALFASPASSRAEAAYPSRPVRIIVPFPGGGSQDAVARLVAGPLAARLGQPVVVDNRPGAAGNLGAEALARAAPDGHTLGVLSGVHTANAAFFRHLSYRLATDFVPIRPLGESDVLVVAAKEAPFATVPEFLAYARGHPGEVQFGSTTSLALDLLRLETGIVVEMVPYKGMGDALQDLMGGRISLVAGPSLQVIGLVRAGEVRALGLASARHVPELPGVATFAEFVPGYDVGMWYGLFAPKATSPAVVQRVADALAPVLADSEVRRHMAQQGIDLGFSEVGVAVLQARMRAETERWRRVAAATGNYVN